MAENNQLERIHQDLDETQDIINKNIENMQKNLNVGSQLVDETDSLLAHSKDFKNESTKLKRTMWWKNTKLWLMFGAIALIIIIIIIIIIAASAPSDEE